MSKNKNKISVIIPVFGSKDPANAELLTKALESLDNQMVAPHEVVLVVPKDEYRGFKKAFTVNNFKMSIIANEGDTSFGSQVNLGVGSAKGSHVMIMGMDDELAPFYIGLVQEYIENQITDDVYLPITINLDGEKFSGFSNEIIWAQAFYNEEGVFDEEMLLEYPSVQVYGMVISKENFIKYGGIKPSIKVSYSLEALLRFAHNGLRIEVIPKLGYKRLIDREGSLSEIHKQMDYNELAFWFELPREEYKFITDRNIAYDGKSE